MHTEGIALEVGRCKLTIYCAFQRGSLSINKDYPLNSLHSFILIINNNDAYLARRLSPQYPWPQPLLERTPQNSRLVRPTDGPMYSLQHPEKREISTCVREYYQKRV